MNLSLLLPAAVEVVTVELDFLEIINTQTLVTPSVNLTVTGSPSITSLTSVTAVELNGVDQFVDLSNLPQDSCLWSPHDCQFGLTVSFTLKVSLNLLSHLL